VRDAGDGMQKAQLAASSLDLDVVHEARGMHSLLRLRASSAAALEKMRPGISAKLDRVEYRDEIERQKQLTLLARKELSKRPDIEWVEPNWILRASVTPNDPLYERQHWHYEQMQLPSAWEITKGSATVIAAVVDTGVRPHEELATQLVDQYDFVDDDTNAADPGVSAQGTYYFHGTHVAGTIAAAGNDGKGVTGVAWNAKIMPVRVLGANGSGTFDDIIQGVAYAARLTNSSGRLPATRADVINLSLGGAGACPAAMQQVVDSARAAGSVIVAAAGNENTSTPSTPAACNGVISVSALDTRRQRAPYSNFGDTVDVAAPGGDTSADRDGDGYPDGIYSTHASRNGTTYSATHTYMQGTSMASPHVAGVIVLMRSVNPNITPAQIDTLLANGNLTDDIGAPGRDSLGVGAINALKAVRAASTNPPAPAPRLDAVPSSLNLGDIGTSNEVVVTNGGAGAIAVTSVTSSAAWLTATQVEVDANGLGRYRIDVNRAGLANGTYQGTVTFNSNPLPPQGVPVTTVSVLIQVASTSVQSNAGQHYLLLIDPATGDAKYQIEVLARGSSVDFNFPSVAQGQYQLSVGTDANNDGLICDDGEACGQYPVYGEPRAIDTTSAVTGLQVTTNYRTDVAPAAATTDNGGRKGQQRLR
jgi:serine protease